MARNVASPRPPIIVSIPPESRSTQKASNHRWWHIRRNLFKATDRMVCSDSTPHLRRTCAVPTPYQGRFMFGFRNEIRGCTRGGTALVRRRCRVGIAIAPPFLCFDRKPHDSATGLLVARCGIIITATRHATSLQTPESPLGRALVGGRATIGPPLQHRLHQERGSDSR